MYCLDFLLSLVSPFSTFYVFRVFVFYVLSLRFLYTVSVFYPLLLLFYLLSLSLYYLLFIIALLPPSAALFIFHPLLPYIYSTPSSLLIHLKPTNPSTSSSSLLLTISTRKKKSQKVSQTKHEKRGTQTRNHSSTNFTNASFLNCAFNQPTGVCAGASRGEGGASPGKSLSRWKEGFGAATCVKRCWVGWLC